MKPKTTIQKILLVGLYDTNTVSLAPQILKHYVQPIAVEKKIDIKTSEFSIFDDDINAIVSKINAQKADVVCFSTYIWNVNIILKVIEKIPAMVVLGGPQVTGIEKELLRENSCIDVIVTGEGEETFRELIEYFVDERALSDIKGITTREIQTMVRPVIDSLDEIPSIYEDTLNHHRNLSWICLETSRGCPMGCKYCTWSMSRKMRYYSVDRVKRDLDLIFSENSIKEIYLCDSNILINKQRAWEILNHIGQKKKDKVIRFEFDPLMLDSKTIDLLDSLSQNEFNFGIQTVNKRALEIVGKRFDKHFFEDTYRLIISKIKMPILTIDLIYGLPGDDIETYKDSLEYALGFREVTRILTNPLIVLPGSSFYLDMDRYKIKLKDKQSYMIQENFSFSKEDMEAAKKYSFYVYVLFFNSILMDCIRAYARLKNQRLIDTVIDFFDSLPFDVTGGHGFPYTIPSIKEGFVRRNKVIKALAKNFADIVACFNQYSRSRFKSVLTDYQAGDTQYFAKMKRLASQ